MKLPIYEELNNIKEKERTPFHMPGHKRKILDDFWDIISKDITEIEGYDNLHHPEGIIKESMKLLKKVYHTKKSWYLVNGSTVGILAAISAVCDQNDKIIISRNCHKSVYNAIRLLHLKPFYIYPQYSRENDMMIDIGKEQKEQIKDILNNNPEVKAVIITSPTYEGVVSDVKKIKEITEKYAIPLIVDEAHGAHFRIHDFFPKSAVETGADLVIQSSHKTLPSMTQTAFLHLCSDMIKEDKIEEMLSIYETSSPSYILLASAEYGAFYPQNHRDKVQKYVDKLQNFRLKCGQLQKIHLITKEECRGYDYDLGKLVFSVKNTSITGGELFDICLREFGIEFEMATNYYCIAMTSLCDESKDYDKLWQAISSVDQRISFVNKKKTGYSIFSDLPDKKYEAWEISSKESEKKLLDDCIDKIAADYIYLYPPGIPIIVPGEKIKKETVENIKYYLYNGYNIPSISNDKIKVLKES